MRKKEGTSKGEGGEVPRGIAERGWGKGKRQDTRGVCSQTGDASVGGKFEAGIAGEKGRGLGSHKKASGFYFGGKL